MLTSSLPAATLFLRTSREPVQRAHRDACTRTLRQQFRRDGPLSTTQRCIRQDSSCMCPQSTFYGTRSLCPRCDTLITIPSSTVIIAPRTHPRAKAHVRQLGPTFARSGPTLGTRLHCAALSPSRRTHSVVTELGRRIRPVDNSLSVESTQCP